MKNNTLLFAVLLIIWVILSWSLSVPELLLGAIVCLITVYATVKLFGDSDIAPSNPLKLSWLLLYCAFVLWDVFKAGIDALLGILRPPASEKTLFLETKTTLKNGTAIGMLMNALTLIPGVAIITTNAKNGSISFHLMSVRGDNYLSVVELAVKKYEAVLKKVFE